MTDNNEGAPLPPLSDEPVQGEPVQPEGVSGEGAPPPAAATHSTREAAKPDVGRRVIAYLIDWVIAMVVYAVLAPASGTLGALVGAAYLLLRDGFEFEFMNGRSLGKRMMNLTVVRENGERMDLTTSAKRNWTLAVSLLPLGLFWLILAPVAALLGLYEAYSALISAEGRRWGDRIAGTRVADAAPQVSEV